MHVCNTHGRASGARWKGTVGRLENGLNISCIAPPIYQVTWLHNFIVLSCWFVTQGNRENRARISGFLALQRGGSFCSLRRVGEIRDSTTAHMWIPPKSYPKHPQNPSLKETQISRPRLFDLRRITSEIWFCGIMPMPDSTLGIHSVLIKPLDLDCTRKCIQLVFKWAFKCFSIVHLRLAVNSFLCTQDALLEAYGTKEQLTQDREMLDAVGGPKTPVVGSQIEQWAETLRLLFFFHWQGWYLLHCLVGVSFHWIHIGQLISWYVVWTLVCVFFMCVCVFFFSYFSRFCMRSDYKQNTACYFQVNRLTKDDGGPNSLKPPFDFSAVTFASHLDKRVGTLG